VSLLAPSMRPAGREVLSKATDTLQNWLIAQFMAMAVVGVLTWLGLWLIGVPLAPILGLIAALLAFIPNIGPIIAAVPAVLLGFSMGPTIALLVVGVYVAVQALESYAITPLIQQERVSLPPALIISMQLLMGVLFGILGLALVTPMAALGLTLVREVYVQRYLGVEPLGDEDHPDAVGPLARKILLPEAHRLREQIYLEPSNRRIFPLRCCIRSRPLPARSYRIAVAANGN
jgi:predicted PurR-regulated permease PerM